MKFENLDIFPKIREDFTKRNTSSGYITVSCIFLMIFLFFSHFISYIRTPPRQRLTVDESPLPTNKNGILETRLLPKLTLYFNVTFHSLPCAFVNFGVLDENKISNPQSYSYVKLKRFDKSGKLIKSHSSNEPSSNEKDSSYCGSCYGLRNGCCNTCKEVRQAYASKGKVTPPLSTIEQCKEQAKEFCQIKDESCQISGFVAVPPNKGLFVISPADSYGERQQYIADYLSMGITLDDFNMSHTINSMSVSSPSFLWYNQDQRNPQQKFWEKTMLKVFNSLKLKSPIDGLQSIQKERSRYKSMYFIRAVKQMKNVDFKYSMSVTHYNRYREGSSNKFPGLYFYYDVAPIAVEYKRDVSFLHFLVDLMAILGGIFALGTLLDHLISVPNGIKQPQAFMN